MTMRFYVYDLVDPRDGKTFYVGKGSGKRPSFHLWQARTKDNSAKCRKIREIITSGVSPSVVIIKRFRDEQTAYDYETARIAELDLSNLTNIKPGGRCDWEIKTDPDKPLAKALVRLALKTNGFEYGYRIRYCGVHHRLPDEFFDSVKARFCSLVERRGAQWVITHGTPSKIDANRQLAVV